MDYTKDAVLIREMAEEKSQWNSTSLLETIIEYLNNSSNATDVGGHGLRNDSQEPYVPYSERPETYIVPVLFAIIFIIGVLGNGTLIRIFIEHRNMRNVPNM
ncbi:unnamed protein product [Allacma fusca]|uniref:Uncharacterized protein n=1 Tax=Allacma fusca TaxID=39272 RepID=A0A8J2PN71_9HEXA|nr:unnamed protein product [Allacma fusca]